MDDQEKAEKLEWLAARRAWLDQKQKQFDEQYPTVHPRLNRQRLDDLEAWRFEIEIHEWELENPSK